MANKYQGLSFRRQRSSKQAIRWYATHQVDVDSVVEWIVPTGIVAVYHVPGRASRSMGILPGIGSSQVVRPARRSWASGTLALRRAGVRFGRLRSEAAQSHVVRRAPRICGVRCAGLLSAPWEPRARRRPRSSPSGAGSSVWIKPCRIFFGWLPNRKRRSQEGALRRASGLLRQDQTDRFLGTSTRCPA